MTTKPETKLTFEDLVARHVGFPELVALRDAGRVEEAELLKYCAFQDDYTARIFAGFTERGAPETATVGEVYVEAELKTFWDGALERARGGAVLQ